MRLLRALLGLLPAVIVGIIAFAVHPLAGILWTLWIAGVCVYGWKRGKK